MQHLSACCVLLAAALGAQSVQHQVVPAAYTSADANSYVWLPMVMRPSREVTLVGPSHLSGMVGRVLTALEFRRTVDDIAYQSGTADLTVTLSTSPRAPLGCSSVFDANVGADATQVFQGQVVAPASPIQLGPNVGWSGADLVRIPFQTPFVYQGGTLCIDITGAPVGVLGSDWWMADAAWELTSGSAVSLGAGCGAYAGSSGEWSYADVHSMLPGGHARFWAHGPMNAPAIAIFGPEAAAPIPLSAFGLPAPGCDAYVDPAAVMLSAIAFFQPPADPVLGGPGGIAELTLAIPNEPWAFGVTLSTQWLDLSQPAVSNGIRWAIAAGSPTLDMALIDGHPNEVKGNVTVHLAHVLRFEYQ